MVQDGEITFLGHEFNEGHLKGVFLVIAATDDKDLNHHVGQSAQARGLLVNAVDQPADCNFIVPSIVRRGDLLIAVSTSGKSPAMAKRLRKELEEQFGPEYAELLVLMGRARAAILPLGLTQEENSRIFQALLDANLLEALKWKDSRELRKALESVLPEKINFNDILES
jgi:precorrin-2 dehydrogenase/sirohydrochlorin ferrochelatase